VKFYRQSIQVFPGFDVLTAIVTHSALENSFGAIRGRPMMHAVAHLPARSDAPAAPEKLVSSLAPKA